MFGMVKQPRMNGSSIGTLDHVRFEGYVVFGGGTISFGVLRGVPWYSTDRGEV